MEIDGSSLLVITLQRVNDPVTVARVLKESGSAITGENTLTALATAFLRIPGNDMLFRALQASREFLSPEEMTALENRMIEVLR